MRNGRTRGDRFRSPLRYFRRSRQRKGRFSKSRIVSSFHLWSNMWSSKIHSKTKSLVNIKFTRLFELALPTRLVGVTGFEPAASWSRTKRSTELSHTPLSYPIQLFSAPPKESTALRLRSPISPISSRPHSAASSATGSAASLAYLAEPHPVKLSYYIVLLSPKGKSFIPSYKTP